MRVVTLTFAAVALGGCGGADAAAACSNYLTVANACIAEAYGDTDSSMYEVPASTCDAYQDVKGDAAKTVVELFDCYVGVYESADCTDPTSVSNASTQLASCP